MIRTIQFLFIIFIFLFLCRKLNDIKDSIIIVDDDLQYLTEKVEFYEDTVRDFMFSAMPSEY